MTLRTVIVVIEDDGHGKPLHIRFEQAWIEVDDRGILRVQGEQETLGTFQHWSRAITENT